MARYGVLKGETMPDEPRKITPPRTAELLSRTTTEQATFLLVSGLVVGSLAMLAWEWAAHHRLHLATVPTSRQQRLLIVSQMGIWVTLCASATAVVFATFHHERSPLLR